MTITLQGVGNKGERHGKHSSPGASDQQEGDELHVLVVEERHHGKAYRAQQQTGCIGHLDILELGQNSSPDNRTDGLNGKEHTHPVACFLEGFAGRVGSIPNGLGNGSCGIVPHIEECCPAEELHQTNLPEGGGRFLQQREPVGRIFLVSILCSAIILRILLWIPLLDLRSGIDNTENQDGCSDVERPDNTVGHNTLLSHITDANEGKDEGEEIASHTSCVAQERLDAVGLGFLLFVHHIAHQHLKGLHGHIDTGIKEHQGYQSEQHGCTDSKSQRTSIGQQAHHQYRNSCTYK